MKSKWITINKSLFLKYLDALGLQQDCRILTVSSYKSNYTRTESLNLLFRTLGLHYKVINYYKTGTILKYFLAVAGLIKHIKHSDVILLHFRGYELFFPVRVITKLFGKKLITDHFVSIWDTVCRDRKKVRPYSFLGKFLLRYDRQILSKSDFILIDTIIHKKYLIEELGGKANKIGHLYVGCNTKLFFPRKVEKDLSTFRVFRYGTVLPLQGLDVILQAAKLCEKEEIIRFIFVGPAYEGYQSLIEELDLSNTIFVDRVRYEELPGEICKSDLCLGGHFNNKIEKAKRVIGGKSYQFIECGIPTILGENPANRELYTEEKNIYWVEMGNSEKLANLIIDIMNEQRK